MDSKSADNRRGSAGASDVPPFRPSTFSYNDKIPETATKSGAERLAQIIMERWNAAGHPEVLAWAEASGLIRTHRDGKARYVYCVRSNLVNGLPSEKNARAIALAGIDAAAQVKHLNWS